MIAMNISPWEAGAFFIELPSSDDGVPGFQAMSCRAGFSCPVGQGKFKGSNIP
jgi:hypothetical protein